MRSYQYCDSLGVRGGGKVDHETTFVVQLHNPTVCHVHRSLYAFRTRSATSPLLVAVYVVALHITTTTHAVSAEEVFRDWPIPLDSHTP